MLTYHNATQLDSSSNRLFKVITGTTGLDTRGGVIYKLLVITQAFGIVGGA